MQVPNDGSRGELSPDQGREVVAGMGLFCADCGAAEPPQSWQCTGCGGVLELGLPDLADGGSGSGGGDAVRWRAGGVWRLPRLLPDGEVLSLGEPVTPLVRLGWSGCSVWVKQEGAMPTGSFMDRGAAHLVAWLARHGVQQMVVDSSGNAAASLAAYAARAGIGCQVYVPRSTSPVKVGQLSAYGAMLHRVAGGRAAATRAALDAAETGGGVRGGGVYVSPAWHPVFLEGVSSLAYEVWEQLDFTAPDAVVVPVGTGTLLLGIARGFGSLRAVGLVDTVPRIYGIQSTACAPLAEAWQTGRQDAAPATVRSSAADRRSATDPPRAAQILHQVVASDGAIIAVDDHALWGAHTELGRSGLHVEPIAALAFAGARTLLAAGQLTGHDQILVPITASGFKATASTRHHPRSRARRR